MAGETAYVNQDPKDKFMSIDHHLVGTQDRTQAVAPTQNNGQQEAPSNSLFRDILSPMEEQSQYYHKVS